MKKMKTVNKIIAVIILNCKLTISRLFKTNKCIKLFNIAFKVDMK